MPFRIIVLMLLMLSGLVAADGGVAESASESAAAEAVVEGLLYFASDDAEPPTQAKPVRIDAGLQQSLSVRLARVFRFPHYHLMGRHTQKVFKEYESWVVPSKDLCLRIDSRGPAGRGGVSVHLQLWQDKKVLVKSDAVILPGRPVFLGGPKWRGGRLVFVVMQRTGAAGE